MVFEDLNCKIHILNIPSAVLFAQTSEARLLCSALKRHSSLWLETKRTMAQKVLQVIKSKVRKLGEKCK